LAVDQAFEAAQEFSDGAKSEGLTVFYHQADVRDEESVAGYVRAAMDRWGKIDVFANNAGIEGPAAPFGEYPVDGFRQVLEVNTVGVFLGLKHVLRVMAAAGGGAVVNTASVAGQFATPGVIAYGASKHAVIGLTRTAAVEFAALGIRVNAVCPGPVAGRMMASIESSIDPSNPGGVHAAYEAAIPMGRYAEVEEVVKVMVWLLTEAPSYLTGQSVTVDGALLIS
jgi:NAD(P)-dependent dehydrogenase (short-subunit alcohol dehydrogenase family)